MGCYSFSQINLFNQCPKKYQFKYLDKYPTEFETSPDLILGNGVHGALERLYNQINVFVTPSKEDLINNFHELRDNGIKEAGEELMYKGDQNEDDYKRRGEFYLNTYYDNNSPFDNSKLIGTELNLYFSVDNYDFCKHAGKTVKIKRNGVEKEVTYPGELDSDEDRRSMTGFIDRLDMEDDGVFVINDYKTNKNLPPENKDSYREQLTLYALGVIQTYKKYVKKVKCRLHYLHFGLTDEREVDESMLEQTMAKYKLEIDKIEKAKALHSENPDNKQAFPIKQNVYCKYCEYQAICPLFSHMNYSDETINGGDLGETTVKNLVDKFSKLSKEATAISKEKENIRDLLIEYADKHNFEQLFGNEAAVSVSKGIGYSVKDKELFKVFLKEKGLFEQSVDVTAAKANKLIKDGELSNLEIEEYFEVKDSWRVGAKKLPKDEKKED